MQFNFFSKRKHDTTPSSWSAKDIADVQLATNGDLNGFKLNHVMVSRETVGKINTCLEHNAHGIKYLKMGSVAYPDRKKDMPKIVDVCRKYDVIPCVGGGATEQAVKRGTLFEYTKELHNLGIDTVEISNSCGDMPASTYRDNIASMRRDFDKVLVEIGTKVPIFYQTRDEWMKDLDAALDINADAVILEGSGAGSRGIYCEQARPNGLLVTSLLERAGVHANKLLIEAPRMQQREYWVNEIAGWNVQLGNIAANDDALQTTERLRINALQPENAKTIEGNREQQRYFMERVLAISNEVGINPDDAFFSRGLYGSSVNNFKQQPDWEEGMRAAFTRYKKDNVRPRSRPIIVSEGSYPIIITEHSEPIIISGRSEDMEEILALLDHLYGKLGRK
jgi:phosphosulfolactate synthase (CoM biosynthesis protein A)